jgi:hypothetical protein
MSQWEKFKNQQKQSPDGEPEGKMIQGSFTCQICYAWVTEGKYFPADGVLSYKCSEGHMSFIEKFNIM